MKFSWPPGFNAWKKGLERYGYVLLVVAVGMLLLLWPQGGEEKETAAQESVQEEFDLEAFEEKLARTLSQIQGAGEAQVVLSLQSGSRQVLAQDREQGSQSSTTTVTVGRGSGSQEVVPVQTVAPQFRGALVVCPGGDDPQVRLAVMEAVSAVTGLGSNHISVCKSAA